jgi:hypothetical protein
MKTYEKVYLNPDIDYVFCYLKETIIEEKDCDCYEHNLECDKNHDILGRTHLKGSSSGRAYAYRDSDPILNSCKYCLEQGKAKRYVLPHDAVPLFNKKENNRIMKFLRKLH